MAFGLGDVSGWLLGYDEPPKTSAGGASLAGSFDDIFLANFLYPQLFEFGQAASATGQSNLLWDMIGKYFAPGTKPSPDAFQKMGAEISQALPGLKQQAAEKQAINFQKTYDTFSKIPALSDIFSKAGGNVDSTGALAKIFGDLSGAALGSAASSGFLTDPAKQNNVLGPLALQKYQIEQSVQQNAQAQALGLVGAGGLPTQGLFAQNMVGGPSPWTGSVLNSAGLFGGLNSQLSLQSQMANQSAFNSYQQAGLTAQMQGFSTMFGGMA